MQDNQYDYVILDMELPLRYGDLPSPAVGNQFLNGLRSRFKTLPIFVVTGKEEKYMDLPKDAIFFGATAYFRKPVPTTGPFSLEAAIKKHVIDPLSALNVPDKWLSCEHDGMFVIWTSVAQNGTIRSYRVKSHSIRCNILYSFLQHIPNDPLISHDDMRKIGGWSHDDYFHNNMPSVKRKLDELSMVADDNDITLNKEHRQKDIRILELKYVDEVEKLYTDSESRVKLLNNMLFERMRFCNTSHLEDGVNFDLITSIQSDLEELNEALNRTVEAFMESHKGKYDHLRELKTELAKRQQAQELKYLELVEKSREDQQRAAERRQVSDEYTKLLGADSEQKQIRAKIHEVVNERRALKDELKARIAERFQIRADIADRINSELRPKIRVTVSQCSNTDAYRELVEKSLKCPQMHYKKVTGNIVSCLPPETLVRTVLDSNMNRLIEDAKLSPDQAKTVISMLKDPDFLAALELVELPDGVKIELNDHGTYKQTETLSTGQKCNAILPILLLDSARPLLIDQPEDNLDNEFVHNIIVESVKDVKTRRQLIFVTHNPNIPVLCDSEQMLVMESDGTSGHIRKFGNVDECKLDINSCR